MTNRSRALRTSTILWWGAGLIVVAAAVGRGRRRRLVRPDIDLDLGGAELFDFSLKYCHVRSAVFARARFFGATTFPGAVFPPEVSVPG